MFHTTRHTHRETRGTFGYSRESVWGAEHRNGDKRHSENQIQPSARDHRDTFRM